MRSVEKKFRGEEPLEQSTIEAQWKNPTDEKAANFYAKQYLKDRKGNSIFIFCNAYN